MIDYEFIVVDPIMGDVSLEDADAARDYAAKIGGKAFMVTWQNGKPVKREAI